MTILLSLVCAENWVQYYPKFVPVRRDLKERLYWFVKKSDIIWYV